LGKRVGSRSPSCSRCSPGSSPRARVSHPLAAR
jgi:hypothetical protein